MIPPPLVIPVCWDLGVSPVSCIDHTCIPVTGPDGVFVQRWSRWPAERNIEIGAESRELLAGARSPTAEKSVMSVDMSCRGHAARPYNAAHTHAEQHFRFAWFVIHHFPREAALRPKETSFNNIFLGLYMDSVQRE